MSKSCERPTLANLSSTDLAEPWVYPYTDFGEGRGKLPRPILRAVIGVGTSSNSPTFSAIVDTGGPVTVVAQDVIQSGGDPVDTGTSMFLRLAGRASEVPLYELTLEARPPAELSAEPAIRWRSLVAVLTPWPHQGTAVMLGQVGFLDNFTVTFGPGGFVLEPADVFKRRYPTLTARDSEP